MILSKKYAVFYREMAYELQEFIAHDGHIRFAKDGVKKFEDGHSCPRMSLIVDPIGNDDYDKSRIRALEKLLDNLEKSYKIVGYS